MMMASWRHIWYWHRWWCCCCCFISQTLKNMDLTTLLFKSAVNNSSGQESSGFGNKAATTSYTKNILWKTCSVKNCSIHVKYFVSVNVMTANRISSLIQNSNAIRQFTFSCNPCLIHWELKMPFYVFNWRENQFETICCIPSNKIYFASSLKMVIMISFM